jgi:Na+/H+ antiporter NhaD/arsenite permease-like protein
MRKRIFRIAFFACSIPLNACLAAGPEPSPSLGSMLPLWSMLPFVGMLLSIAIFPLAAGHWWEHNRHKGAVTAAWSLILAVPLLAVFGNAAWSEIKNVFFGDYIPFILLLGALFTVSGGIFVGGTFKGTPWTNTLLLGIGTLAASLLGTTGASMLMIRPVLRANRHRRYRAHVVVFFIFLVSNIGGALTPLGDPPLFLGFLHGVPFFWTLRLAPIMAVASVLVLSAFFIWDSLLHRREEHKPALDPSYTGQDHRRFHVDGLHNMILLAVVLGAVLMSGFLKLGGIMVAGVHLEWQNLLRDVILLNVIIASAKTTPKRIHEKNEFSWAPIQEVAILFVGIFVTIIPVISMLKAGVHGSMGPLIRSIREPVHYFWVTGGLSSFLDNAPTYLTLLNTALGNLYAGISEPIAVARLLAENPVYLKAIAAGAVFMGANTYIGNAPNFMVRSIAEEKNNWNIRMPNFFTYMLYSGGVLIPIFLLVGFIFF